VKEKRMRPGLAEVSRTLLFHYYPAWLGWSCVHCTVFASLAFSPELTFWQLFLHSQLQVLAIYAAIIGALRLCRPQTQKGRVVLITCAMMSGVLVWEAVLCLASADGIAPALSGWDLLFFMILRVVSGGFVVWCFLLAESYCLSEVMLRAQKISRLTAERDLTENEIHYLKARIDPDLLMKRLRHILILRDSDPAAAGLAQTDLVRYLRRVLATTSDRSDRNHETA
jgi:hypothetical protein